MLARNLTLTDRFLRLLLALLAGWVAMYAFQYIVPQILAGAATLWFLFEAMTGWCPLHRSMGVRRPGDAPPADRLYLFVLLGIQAIFAYTWWHAGWEKITSTFVADLPQTFTRFAGGNPYPLYKTFLESVAIPNAATFGLLVQWSQLMIGVVLALSVLVMLLKSWPQRTALVFSLFALVGGMLMNANFWLAGAWTGPGTATSNVVMFWVQLLLAYVWFECLRHASLRK